jgi:hypothetical protein
MLANGSALYKYLDPIFEAEGFQRKKDTWYWHTEECICFFLTKKSPYGSQFDDVMGCFVKRVYGSDQEFPPFNKANLKFTLGDMKDQDWVKQTFDLSDTSFKKDERESRLRELMEKYAIPFLKGISTEEGIRKTVKKIKDLKYNLDGNTREMLGIKMR